jgi:hypothetical protein
MPVVDDNRSEAHQFVWDVGGSERFHALLGRYLPVPRWNVRIATFEGDVANRAEEWAVLVSARGEAERVAHQLPESRAGASLSEDAARALALGAIERVLQLPAASLREVSAQPAKLSARTDWLFTFQDLTIDPIPLRATAAAASADAEARGDARIEAHIAGDEVARVRPFVRVPEAWQRERRAQLTFAQIMGLVGMLLAGSALVSAAVTGVIAWSRRRDFDRRVLVAIFAMFAVTSLISSVNEIPSTIARLSTSQPFQLQLAMIFGLGVVAVLVPGAIVALAAGTLPFDMPKRRTMTTAQRWIAGVSLGAIMVGASALMRGAAPPWPDDSALGTYIPMLAWAIDRIPPLMMRSITLLALLTAIDDFSDGWTRHRALYTLVLIAAGALLGTRPDDLSFAEWLPIGAAAGTALFLAYVFVLRDDLSLIPLAIATAMVCGQLRDGLLIGRTDALVGAIAGAAVTAIVGAWMFALLRGARDRSVPSAAVGS